MQEWAEKRRNWLAAGAVIVLALASLRDWVGVVPTEDPFGMEIKDGRLLYIRDFPSHLRFAREVK